MVINEKALVRQMKESYKNQGYNVVVNNDWMVITNGFWLIQIDMDNVPNEVLSLIALHMRLIPDNGDAYKVIKGDDGPILHKKMLDAALQPVIHMEDDEAATRAVPVIMKKTCLRYDGCCVWQSDADLSIFLIDPRYEALIDSKVLVRMVGNGLYAEDDISKAWVLRVSNESAKDHINHLAGIRWVAL